MFSQKKLSTTITDMIRFDHSDVMVTFHQYAKDKKASVRKALADTLCEEIEIHATLEEEIFYPVMRLHANDLAFMDKAEPEHDKIRVLIAKLRNTSASDPDHEKLVQELMRQVIHHVADEETSLLPRAEAVLPKARLAEMGSQMAQRRMQLSGPQAGKLAKEHAAGFTGSRAAVVLGLASALYAAHAVSKRSPAPSSPAPS
jgi:hemerythrin superfamily protein